ncbi:putative membrane-bound ClpP-class protease [Dissulfuribacter thermophilus]|uniref:Putative membrane-bound ClpP-class protease n=1 Tax=Dissulfuribacter thermophilus TaxID=1156395 RepID=A0A1B9F3J5_9BACT|nr:nodulation protein NfeD [Dissulfuribacter thermophilus]OCC14433.1 putative membrane-bound ClpP-class protease [Dissulfuribacter thermophilus]
MRGHSSKAVFSVTLLICVLINCLSAGRCLAVKSTEYKIKKIFMLKLSGSINPGSKEVFIRAIEQADATPSSLLVILLNTPGGLVTTLREMVQAMMDSEAPIAVFVYPPGAQAASAGTILTMAAHIAAMAPGTNIGAAHPVSIGVPQTDSKKDTMSEKAENDIAAMARSIAQEMGRNATWAERAVRKSVSATAKEALELGVVDLICKDLEDLLKSIDGRTVRLKGKSLKLSLDSPIIEEISPTFREKVLNVIADPNVAYILMMIGIAGLYFELAQPGAIFPGAIGAVSLLLGLYALQALPVSAVGLLLIVLGTVLFVLELLIVSQGILGLFGFISLVLGSLMLFKTDEGALGISLSVLVPTLLGVGSMLFAIVFVAAKATLSRPKSGKEALIGEKGVIKKKIADNECLVYLHGELWRATCDQEIREGQEVVVTGIDGLRLKVK